MAFFRRFRSYVPLKDGTFAVNLSAELRAAIVITAQELQNIMVSDAPEVRRLFPTAYVDDPERDKGFQVFAKDQLIEQRYTAVGVMQATVDSDVLTEEELSAWMRIMNDMRLVLGTKLDVSEDDHEVDFEADDADDQAWYHILGQLLGDIVEALATALPEPDEDILEL